MTMMKAVDLPRPPLLLGVSPSDYSEILSVIRVKDFGSGELLYLEGDSVQSVLLVTSGLVKITQSGRNGEEVILRLTGPGDVLAVVDHFSGGRHRTTAEGFRSGQAIVWEGSVFKGLMARFPVLHQNTVRILGEDLLELEERFREVATERVGARVAGQLLRLLKKIGRPVNDGVEIALSQEELAQMTGTTLYSVCRLLSGWQARGIVRSRRQAVTVCDIRSLRERSNESELPEERAKAAHS